MKTRLQVLNLLNQYAPASELDRNMITAFLEKTYHITPTVPIFAQEAAKSTIDTQSFLKWYKDGYGAFEVAKMYNNNLVILGTCTLNFAAIAGVLQGTKITVSSKVMLTDILSKAAPKDTKTILEALLSSNLQLNPATITLAPKYIPAFNEKILYHSYDFETNGIGIVHDVNNDTQEIELYCYFTYPTKATKGGLGYSMHERNIINLRDYVIEPLLETSKSNSNRFSNDDGVSAYRRLKRELEKAGKVWRDKLNRIEPSRIKLEKGATYWYINDKLKVIQEIDKGTPTSQQRYLCGNYFTTNESALVILNKIRGLINDYLATPQWPNIDND